MNKKLIYSDNELEIMDVIWKAGRPLSKAEIIELSPNKGWKDKSVYILLNSLLKKGAIKEDGFVKNQTNYGRTFVATMSENEYMMIQINAMKNKINLSLPELMLYMIDKETEFSIIQELEQIINDKMNDINDIK